MNLARNISFSFASGLKQLLIGSCFLLSISSAFAAQNHLQVEGNRLVDKKGQQVTLRGFGLGGWMLPEGYMLEFPDPHSSPTKIRQAVVDLTDEAFANSFFQKFEKYYVTEDDLKQVKAWGFNSVRIAFNANRILPPEKQQVGKPLVFDKSGMALLDQAVRWASEIGLYVVLDMHGAPGGQSKHNIADATEGALLWEKPDIYWPRTIALWEHLAQKYKDNAWVIGYDLLNEPMVPGSEELGGDKLDQHNNAPLRELYEKLSMALRRIDNDKKILFIEGGFWAQNLKGLMPPWDSNMVYAFHAYPAPATVDGLPKYVAEAYKKGYPIWFGEGGENYSRLKWEGWLAHNKAFTQMLEKETFGWSWWTTKKYSRTTQPWQCFLPEQFSLIKNYLAGHGPKPDKKVAKKILTEYVANLQTKNCQFIPEVIESLGGRL